MKLIRFFLVVGIALMSQLMYAQYYYTIDTGDTPGGLNQDWTLINPAVSVGGWTNLMGPSVTTPIWSEIQTIPFAFDFNGDAVTEYKVSSTGVLTFTTTAVDIPGATPLALPNAAIPDNSICIWGMEASVNTSYVTTKNFGVAGSKQHWILFSSCANGALPWSYWSIVLEEGTNNIYICDQYDWSTTGALTVGIQIDLTEAYSDPLSPAVPSVANTSVTSVDDLYYTFIHGVQSTDDVELVSLDYLPYVAPGAVDIKGSILNTGINTITELTVTWNDGTGPYVDNITGLNILANQPYSFISAFQLNTVGGTNYPIDVNVTIPGDGNSTNNDLSKPIFALDSIPKKYVVGEEKTGTWCGWCPRGAVALANMESVSDFIGIAVHNGDPMKITSYDGSIGLYVPGGYPGAGVDRVEEVDLVDPAGFMPSHDIRVATAVPCDVKNITVEYNQTSNNITVSAESEWYGSIYGDYRFSCIIVEDDVLGTGSSWLQANYYSGGGSGVMAFPEGINNGYDFSTGADPEDPTLFGGYDHVARSLSSNDILGDIGSLPAGLVPSGIYSYTFDPVSTYLVDDVEKCHAIVMIVNSTTGEILNAYKAPLIDVGVGVKELENNLELTLFPNPASDKVFVSMNIETAAEAVITVIDAFGNIVILPDTIPTKKGTNIVTINASDLTNGLYFVNIVIGDEMITKMISVVH